MRKISLDRTILDVVNFRIMNETVPGYIPGGVSALEALISLAGIPAEASNWQKPRDTTDSLPYLEYVIASTLADAISRAGAYRNYDTSGPAVSWPFVLYNTSNERLEFSRWDHGVVTPPTKENITEMRVHQTVIGYAYQLGLPQILSVAVLLCHLLLAFGHTIYILAFNPRTSNCWDTVFELIALAQQSIPSYVLQDTWAGISEFAIFRARVRIIDRPSGGLELIFVSADENRTIPDVNIDDYTEFEG